MGWFLFYFFVSEFCSILYEIVWLRLAMAQFGFHSFDNRGFHFLASHHPIAPRTAIELADRIPAMAAAGFVEWGPERLAEGQFRSILRREISLDQMTLGAPQVPALQDDRRENEYFILRERLPGSWLSWMPPTRSMHG